MSEIVIFDTSVLVDEARTGRHRRRIASVGGLVRTSSVVLAELLRGVIGPAEHKFLRALARNHPVLTPTKKKLAGVGPDTGPHSRRSRLRTAQIARPAF